MERCGKINEQRAKTVLENRVPLTRPVDQKANARLHQKRMQFKNQSIDCCEKASIDLGRNSVMTEMATATTGRKTISGKSKVIDQMIDLLSFPSISSHMANEDPNLFRHTHLAKRGCPKLLIQASRDKDYEINMTITKDKLHQLRLRSNFTVTKNTSKLQTHSLSIHNNSNMRQTQ